MARFLGKGRTTVTHKILAYNSAGDIWDKTANAGAGGYVAPPASSANPTNYHLTATEKGTGRFYGVLPAATSDWELVELALTFALTSVVAVGSVATPASGNGAFLIALTALDEDDEPIVGALVRLSLGGESFEDTTDEAGLAELSVNAGTYRLTGTAANHRLSPADFVVTGDDEQNIVFDTQVPVAAAPAGKTNAYTYTMDGHGDPIAGVVIQVSIISVNNVLSYDREILEGTSVEDTGLVEIELPQNAMAKARRGTGAWTDPFSTGTAGTVAMPQTLTMQPA